MFFWFIYGGGIVFSAGIESVLNQGDFSALYNDESATIKYFISALAILVVSILITTSQRLLDLGLGNFALMIVVVLMVIPVVAPIIVFLLGIIPGLKEANRFGVPPISNSYFIIASAVLAPFLIYITWVLARLIKSSSIPM